MHIDGDTAGSTEATSFLVDPLTRKHYGTQGSGSRNISWYNRGLQHYLQLYNRSRGSSWYQRHLLSGDRDHDWRLNHTHFSRWGKTYSKICRWLSLKSNISTTMLSGGRWTALNRLTHWRPVCGRICEWHTHSTAWTIQRNF